MKATAERSRRIMIVLFAACAQFLRLARPPEAHAGSFNPTVQFAITNGNPNGRWSYGWMATNFTSFTLLTNASFVTNLHVGWWGPMSDNTPSIWKNLRTSTAYGVPPGFLSLHPGPGGQPSVLRWESPAADSYKIRGLFYPGDGGVMRVGVRKGGQFLWEATDSGLFNLVCNVAAGEPIDFVVFGGFISGNTPLEVIIKPTCDVSSFNPREEFDILDGNPNGVWSYGWMTTNFTGFTLFTNSFYQAGLHMGWHGGMRDNTPAVWKNLRTGGAYGVGPGQLTLHPGPGKEPAVLRWTAPVAGFCTVTGTFYAGDSGVMRVGVRRGDQFVWQATNSGTFNLEFRIAESETIDFVVFGGWDYGNTPLEATITLNHPQFTRIERTGPAIHLTIANLVPGRTNTLAFADSLTSTNWTPLLIFVGEGPSTNLVDDISGEITRRFYRMVVH